MATRKLSIEAELRTRGLKKGTVEFQKEFAKMSDAASRQGSKVKGSNLALIELGRGLADFKAGGGLQDFSRGLIGSTNNMERFIEIMGNTIRKSGGLGAALKGLGKSFLGSGGILLGITLLISYGPEIVKFFKNLVSGADESSEAVDKLSDALLKQQGVKFDPNQGLYAGVEEAIEDIDKNLRKIDRIEANRIRQGKVLEQKYVDQREQLIGQRAEYAGLIQDSKEHFTNEQKKKDELEQQRKAAKKLREELDAIKEQEDIKTFASEEGLGILSSEDGFRDAFDINTNEVKLIDVDDIEVVDEYADSLQDLNDILKETGSLFANMSVEQATAWMKANEDFEKARVGADDVATSIVGAFESAATQGGNFLENLASGMLSSIGSLLIKEGTAYVALGLVRNTIVPGWGTPSIVKGGAAVAAGIALKAGGSAIGNARNSGSGSSSSASPSSQTSSVTPDLRSIQGSGSRGRNIGGLSTRDGNIVISSDIIREAMQASGRKYDSLAG